MSNACKFEPSITVERWSVVVDMWRVLSSRQGALLVTQDNGGYTKWQKCVKIEFGGNEL